MAHSEPPEKRGAPVPGARRKAVPIALARGPDDSIPAEQEDPVHLTSLAALLHVAQNWARSKAVWLLGDGRAWVEWMG